ncbi:MAG TPA: protease pro-enzyme activation domain-containing protein, partial [Nevskiaceae bacterium]|nr:protease pro-enzyme activation domain-containing protein [Nevskiaceae bacterium]
MITIHSRLLPFAALCALALSTQAQAGWDATLSRAVPLDSSIATAPVPAGQRMRVLVSLKMQNADALKQYIMAAHTPGNPVYGHFLTPAQYTAGYAPSAAQAQKVVYYLRAQGFDQVTLAGNRMLVSALGTAAQVQAAFNTRLAQFSSAGKSYYANVTDAQVPDTLGGVVLAVIGVKNTFQMKTHLQQQAESHPQVPYTREYSARLKSATDAGSITMVSSFPPSAWDIAYDAGDTPDGSNTTIAISTAGDDVTQVIKDLRQMEREQKLPFVPVEVRITTPLADPQDTSGDGEWSLDSQSSTAIARNVKKLIFYTVDTTVDLLSTYNEFATRADAQAGNMSYGACDITDPYVGATGGVLPELPD